MKNTSTKIVVGALLFFVFVVKAFAGNIDSAHKFAWGENVGWLNFGSSQGNVTIGNSNATGYAWGENIGWLSLNCSNTSSCGTVNYGVTRAGGELAGYAWGENIGWVSFNCSNTASCGIADYGVTVSNNGTLAGYAWGENIGWISFNCSNTASCGSVNYYVKVGSSNNSGGFLPSPSATPTPTVSPSVVPTATPIPSGTPRPSGTPVATPVRTPLPPPSPFPTPSSLPPPIMPPGPPPTTTPTPPGPIGRVISGLGDFFDRLGQALFGPFDDSCRGALGLTACGVTAMTALAVVAGLIAALIQNELIAALFSFFQVIGLRKKARVWGIVYDSATKHPIPAAKLELLDVTGRVMEVRFTDRDGRYGFLTTPASLNQQELKASIRVTKPGYRFPSAMNLSGTDYVVYENLYRGGQFNVVGDGLLNFSIPMDPTNPQRTRLSGFGRGLFGNLTERFLSLAFVVGLIVVPLNYYFRPTTMNLVILIVFFVVNTLRLVVMYRPYGITVDAMTGKKLPFALVTLLDEQGTRVGFAVSDEHGRYVLSAQRNRQYDAVAYTPANIVPQRTVRQRISRLSHIGRTAWVTLTLRV